METSLGMDSKTKHLCVHFKKRIEHSSDTALKVRGVLDTVTAQGRFQASLNKFFRLGKAPLVSASDPFQPDTRLRLGFGAKASSDGDEVHFTASAKKKAVLRKQQEVVRGRVSLRSFTQLAIKADYDFNVRTEKWEGEAVALASHAMFGFTEGQDLRITAGYRGRFTQRGVTSTEPFVRVQENCWGVQTTWKQGNRVEWLVTYDL